MTQSLKDANRLQLFAVLTGNLVLYYALVKGLSLQDVDAETLKTHLTTFLPGGLALALCGILNSQLTYLQKARIVFLRWHDPLPGSRAFSHYAPQDPRINMKAVRAKWSPLPKGAPQQNALWYQIYQQERGTGAVDSLNRHWLFARDHASLCVLLLLALGALGIYQMSSPFSWLAFAGILLSQFLLARRSAVNYAERFVLTVIAQAAAKPNPPE